ncbi:hypothetical protein CC86DRAFT_424079 [Ophiobolus disseminans]|uniref:Uncharacterized protein n=1 Tax=Ophiobolus disseminans TaxID=1469910 RepID=A0A6A7AEV9_9PLEO|nr:hypothetical protein CC86DRAFT_424079 [Ophiobolus disseminans]
MWTVQEYLLAQDVVFRCGQHQIQRKVVFAFIENFSNHFDACCSRAPVLNQNDLEIAYARIMRHDTLEIHDIDATGESSFIVILIALRGRKLHDPRDKIYGVLSLADMLLRHMILPNYDLLADEVYEEMVTASIDVSRSLDILSCVYKRYPSCIHPSSFVPD